jgi:uncharacterized protein involved in exopolysaccharide biosynthesis
VRRTGSFPSFVRSLATLAILSPSVAGADTRDGVARASLIVLRDVATAAAVDPVETQQMMLLSRTFLGSLPGVPGTPELRKAIEVLRIGRSGVLEVTARARSQDQAQRICSAVISAALRATELLRKPELSFLTQQSKTLAGELRAAEAALHAFKKGHGFLAVSLADQQQMASRFIQAIYERLTECRLGKKCSKEMASELERSLEQAKKEALGLNLLEVELRRHQRQVETTEKLRALVEQRLSEARLGHLLNPELRLLDPCAAVPAR